MAGLTFGPEKLAMMQLFLCYLTLLFVNISFAVSATPPALDAQVSQVNLPSNVPGGPVNSSIAVQIANQTVSAGRQIACFIQKEKHEERLWWIKYMDCYSSMARGILLGDDTMLRKIWTEYEKPGSWNSGTCMIILDQKGAAAPGIQKAEIAHVASTVTRFCVRQSPDREPLGGQTSIGERDAYTLTVFGREWFHAADTSKT